MSITEQKELIPTLQSKLLSIRQLLSSSNASLTSLIDQAIDQLSNNLRQSNFRNISITALHPLFKILSLQNEKLNYLIIDTITTIINNHLLPQTSYTLILQVFNDILHHSTSHRIIILELLMKMIDSQSIQISTKNIQCLFSLGVIINNYPKHKKNSTEFLYNLIIILFEFLDNLLRPVVFKRQKQQNIVSHINLDTEEVIKEKKKKMNSSFYTITESQSEVEQSQYGDKEDLEEKNIEIDLSEYKDCDIYTSCLWVFQYLLDVLNGNRKDSCLAKQTTIDFLLGIIYTTQKLFFYMNDYITLIRNDLGKSLAGILQSNSDFSIRFKAIKLSYYIISTFHYCYYIIPLCLNPRKHFCSIEKYLCYELISKHLKDTLLLSDLYLLQLSTSSPPKDHILDIILSFLSKDSLDAIALLPKGGIYSSLTFLDDNTTIKSRSSSNCSLQYNHLITSSIHRSNYISILIQICNSLEYTHLHILKSHHIQLDSFIMSDNEHFIEQYKFIKKKMYYYYPSVKNVLMFLINEKIATSSINQYVDKLIIYIKIYTVIHLDKAKDELVNMLIGIIDNKGLFNDGLIYLSRELFNYAEQKQFNQDIEAWLSLINIMQKIFIRLHNEKGNGLFLPSPSIDIEIYLRFIEHHLRTFSFNYYETIFVNNSIDNNDNNISDEVLSSCNNDLPTTHSMIESPETNYASVFVNCMKIKKPLNFRKTSHNIPHPTSFIEPESLVCIADIIETVFISSTPSYGDEYLISSIINAFIKNSINVIKKYSRTPEQVLQLKFNIMKLTDVAASNISRINLLWEKFLLVLNEIFSIKDCEINVMTFDALVIVSMVTIHSYQEVENMSEEWTKENYQGNIFGGIRRIIEVILESKREILHFAVNDLYFMIMHIGKKMTMMSWEDYIHMVLFILEEIEDTYSVYSLCEQIFNSYYDMIKGEHGVLLVEMIQVVVMKSNKKVKENCLGNLMLFLKEDSEIDMECLMKIKTVLLMKIIDNDYTIRKKALDFLMIKMNDQGELSSNNDFNKQLFICIEKIYESYKDKVKKRGLVYDFNKKTYCKCNSCRCDSSKLLSNSSGISSISSNSNDTEIDDDYGFCIFKGRIEPNHIEMPLNPSIDIKETQEERQWEDTLIQALSLLQHNDLYHHRDLFCNLTINILYLASPSVLNQLVLNHIHIESSSHSHSNYTHNESISLSTLITHLSNYLSSDFVYYNWPMDDSLIPNFIQFLDIILDKDNESIKISMLDLAMKLLKVSKKQRDHNIFNDLNTNESLLLDFLSKHQKHYKLDILEFYIRNIKLDNDTLIHSKILCITFINKLVSFPYTDLLIQHITILHKAFNGLIKLLYNKTFQQKFLPLQQPNSLPFSKILFKSYTQITSIIMLNDSKLDQLKIYDQMLQLSQFILSSTNDDIFLLDLSEYLTIELLAITEERYANARYRLIAIITNYLFKVKNTTILSLVTKNLLGQHQSKIAKELIGMFIKEKIEEFINEEKRDNMPIQKYKINELLMIMTIINDEITENMNVIDKELIELIKTEMNVLMQSSEIQLALFAKKIVNRINKEL